MPRPLPFALALVVSLSGCGHDDESLRLVGTVERTLLEMVAPTSEVISEIEVARGERVEPGRTLARLDATLADAELARSEAALAAARTALMVAEIDLERARKLRLDRVASQQELDRAHLAHEEAQARSREAEASLAVARKRRADLVLAAPVAGVVDQLPFERGERVPAGAVLVVMLAEEDPWVRVWVPETSFARIEPGTPASIRIDGVGGRLRGSVLDVAREPAFTPHYALTERDRVHLVYETRVRILDAPAALRPGIPAEVEIVVGRSDVADAP
jgi:HlyD family secretion protein